MIQARNIDWGTVSTHIKAVLVGKLGSNSVINGGAIIPLSEESKFGVTGISVNSAGQFKIEGTNISRVLLFASWTGVPEASGFRRVHIRKNSSMTNGYAFTTTDVATGYLNGAVAGIMLNVSDGDTIDLYNRDTKMTFWTGTRMTAICF